MAYQFYQLPDDPDTYLEYPLWVKDAISTKDIRVTADGEDVYVRTPVGEVQVEPTDYIVRSSRGNIFVLSEELFENLAGVVNPASPPPSPPSAAARPGPKAGDLIHPSPLSAPPYSSGVLARSARARAEQAAWESTPQARSPEKQAEFDALPKERQKQLEPDATDATPATPSPDNAHVEGADEPVK
jgi:hypothetical protein